MADIIIKGPLNISKEANFLQNRYEGYSIGEIELLCTHFINGAKSESVLLSKDIINSLPDESFEIAYMPQQKSSAEPVK